MMIRINLLPVEGKGQKRAYTQLALMVVTFVASLGLIGYLWYQQTNRLEEMDKEIAEKNRMVAQLRETIKKVEEFEKKREVIKQKLEVITSTKKLQTLPVHVMMELVDTLPDPVWLTIFNTTEGGRFEISGFALSYNAIGNLLESLESARFFMGPELTSAVRTVYGGKEVIAFNMSFGLDLDAVNKLDKY